MALVPFRQPAGRPSQQSKEKQLVLAEWEDAGPGRWMRRTKDWMGPEEEGGDKHLPNAPGPD